MIGIKLVNKGIPCITGWQGRIKCSFRPSRLTGWTIFYLNCSNNGSIILLHTRRNCRVGIILTTSRNWTLPVITAASTLGIENDIVVNAKNERNTNNFCFIIILPLILFFKYSENFNIMRIYNLYN